MDLTTIQQAAAGIPDTDPLALQRKQAMSTLTERGLPNHSGREERFRFLNLRPLLSNTWTMSPTTGAEIPDGALEIPAATQLVCIDGRFSLEHSTFGPTIEACSLETAIRDGKLDVAAFAAANRYQEAPMAAVNTALFQDGLYLKLPAGQKITEVISLRLYASSQSNGHMLTPRMYIVAEDGAEATIVEQYCGADAAYLTNSTVHFELGANTDICHYRVQRESEQALHIATSTIVHHGPDSKFESLAVNFGASWFRHDLFAALDAERVECTLNGIVLLNGGQVSDTHSRTEHLQPNAQSNELYKGVLADKSHSIFNGRIYVDQKAQQTNAFQSNPNMLLSDDAIANSNPELEIYADDVRCTHGATCGDLNDEAMFYLRARGLDATQAHDMLVYAFLSELVDGITLEPLREQINRELFEKLSRTSISHSVAA